METTRNFIPSNGRHHAKSHLRHPRRGHILRRSFDLTGIYGSFWPTYGVQLHDGVTHAGVAVAAATALLPLHAPTPTLVVRLSRFIDQGAGGGKGQYIFFLAVTDILISSSGSSI